MVFKLSCTKVYFGVLVNCLPRVQSSARTLRIHLQTWMRGLRRRLLYQRWWVLLPCQCELQSSLILYILLSAGELKQNGSLPWDSHSSDPSFERKLCSVFQQRYDTRTLLEEGVQCNIIFRINQNDGGGIEMEMLRSLTSGPRAHSSFLRQRSKKKVWSFVIPTKWAAVLRYLIETRSDRNYPRRHTGCECLWVVAKQFSYFMYS